MQGIPADADPRVAKLLDSMGVSYEVTEEKTFKLLYEVGTGRQQVAYIESKTSRMGHFEMRLIWSIACVAKEPFHETLANQLLELNHDVEFGGWRVKNNSDGDRLLYFGINLAADTDGASFAQCLNTVLEMADYMENALTGGDDKF